MQEEGSPCTAEPPREAALQKLKCRPYTKGLMSSVQVQEQLEVLLPLCEANRQLVVNPLAYAANVQFRVGPLRLIDKAP
jgi:hypothetical protein